MDTDHGGRPRGTEARAGLSFRRRANQVFLLRVRGGVGRGAVLNWVWLGLIAFSVLLGGFTGRIDAVGSGAIDNAQGRGDPGRNLVAVMTLWLGMMRLATAAGLIQRPRPGAEAGARLAVPRGAEGPSGARFDHHEPGRQHARSDNAATPLGLKAMEELQTLNPRPDTATNAMCHAAGDEHLQPDPGAHHRDRGDDLGARQEPHRRHRPRPWSRPLIAQRRGHRRRQAAGEQPGLPPSRGGGSQRRRPRAEPAVALADYAAVLEDAEAHAPPMVRGGRLVLIGAALAFLAMLLIQAFPEWLGRPIDPAEARQASRLAAAGRPVQAGHPLAGADLPALRGAAAHPRL